MLFLVHKFVYVKHAINVFFAANNSCGRVKYYFLKNSFYTIKQIKHGSIHH